MSEIPACAGLLRNADRHPTEMLRQHELAGYVKLANQKKE
jgi:hypothetical protein